MLVRNSVDHSSRQREVRIEEGQTAEDVTKAAKPAAGLLQMDDMRVLVGEHQPQPVVRVADETLRCRRHCGDFDEVERNHRRPTVRLIGLIDEDDVHAAARSSDVRVQVPCNFFGDAREALRERLLALMVMNVESWCRQRSETESRVITRGLRPERLRHTGTTDGQQQQDAHDIRDAGHLHHWCGRRLTSLRNVKSAIGESLTPWMSAWNTATFVLYQRPMYGTSSAMICCARV